MRECDEREAVFWCGLLHEVLFGQIERGKLLPFLRELSRKEYVFPDGRRCKPSISTLKRKLKLYREKGFVGLPRKRREDLGAFRAEKGEVLASAIGFKCENPKRSVATLNQLLKARHGKRIARSTLYRHLKAAGATRMRLGLCKEPVRKRWTCEHTHDLWQGDFEHGPFVLLNGEAVPTRLSAFIDSHSRYIVAARYYLSETLDVLCDTLIRALDAHGLPRILYLDNAKVYHSNGLKALSYRLHIDLRHRPPGDPACGGLIERFFQNVQNQLESEVRAGQILTLERLNEGLSAWLEQMYHDTVHSETGQTPQERYQSGFIGIRQADMENVAESFLRRERRTVDKRFSDVKLSGRLYRVEPKYRGERIEVRFDPFGDGEKIYLYSLHDEYLGIGVRHRREERIEPEPPPPPASRTNLIDVLIDQQKRLERAERGVDFTGALLPKRWSFSQLAACLADLLGRRGGVSAFNAEETDVLRQIHERFPSLTPARLKQAVATAYNKTLTAIVLALQELNRKEEE
jgi:transposase InsO family protein